jgi:hypothetical protein
MKSGGAETISLFPKSTFPAVTVAELGSNPTRAEASVDFPLPLSPTMPTIRPLPIFKSTEFTAVTLANLIVRF